MELVGVDNCQGDSHFFPCFSIFRCQHALSICFYMRILAANLTFRLVAVCEIIVEPMSRIYGLIRRCTNAIGLGTSRLSHRKRGGGNSLLCPLHVI